MVRPDFATQFISTLYKRIPNKKRLAYEIADILHIEVESSYRRLAGRVNFSINEIAVIARRMNISLDTLLHGDVNRTSILVDLDMNSSLNKMDHVIGWLQGIYTYLQTANMKNLSVNTVFDSLPVEFFLYYPSICKYIYFKWGYYYIGTQEFDRFSAWEIPAGIVEKQNQLKENFVALSKVRYTWDIGLMPNLVNEINFHLFLGILTADDAELLKNDLHDLLVNYEEFVKRRKELSTFGHIEPECYVTNLNVGLTAFSMISKDPDISMSSINLFFLHSPIDYDQTNALKINEWINSLKKVSYLISGSGDKERATFFRNQHRIVDIIGAE